VTILALCPTHKLSWDIDFDPPECDCEYDIMVIEQPELPFYNHLDNDVQVQ
jgi:hypothetical protein